MLPLVNDERSKGSHALVGLKSLRDAISKWKRAHPEIEKEKSIHDCIDDIYAERGRLPTTDELHSRIREVRDKSNEKSYSQKSLSTSISSWKRAHPEIEEEKSVHDCIDDLYAERGRLQRLMSYVRE